MAKPESQFYSWLSTKLKSFGIQQWDRIESATTRGIPDIDVCHKGICCKIELKYETGNVTKIRPEQRNWINKRIKSGGLVYILVKRKTAKLDRIELYSGEQVNALFYKEYPEPIMTAPKRGTEYVGITEIIEKIAGK